MARSDRSWLRRSDVIRPARATLGPHAARSGSPAPRAENPRDNRRRRDALSALARPRDHLPLPRTPAAPPRSPKVVLPSSNPTRGRRTRAARPLRRTDVPLPPRSAAHPRSHEGLRFPPAPHECGDRLNPTRSRSRDRPDDHKCSNPTPGTLRGPLYPNKYHTPSSAKLGPGITIPQ